ncbi:MAG: PEP-CTERM sorting domain-containing protein [Candidatus Thiodiazotropha sp. (ex Epidulcina cf. delphinae)]|nr:PEP-CTERM sorting domain-containing protein [Candidatus Thiodiazotropha sp. (ex Epidulcina cf. delphinae)]
MTPNTLTLTRRLCAASLLACTALSGSAWASLDPFQSFTGNVAISTDGFGSLSNAGVISASVPLGSTVVAAYLYSSTYFTTGTPTVTVDGSAVTFGPRVPNATACCSLASFRADVTSIVAPTINGGGGGVYNFNIAETALGNNTDGEALVVVYENAALPEATVGILDGFASVVGDTTSINFADPLDPTEAGFFAEMALGIGFSCCNQKSTVEVNGLLMTENAGNKDDGVNGDNNGNLITVGSFDDPLSPVNPTYAQDTERYDLSSFITLGDTSISVDTINASQDDNIFLASFYVSGQAGFNEPPPSVPEPGTLMLTTLGLFGIVAAKRRRRRA